MTWLLAACDPAGAEHIQFMDWGRAFMALN